MTRKFRTLLALALSAAAPLAPAGQPALPPPDPQALRRWQEMRFGLFLHWGPVSIKGTEIGWSRGAQVPAEEYDALHRSFNPTRFDADRWAEIAADAGMKYVVLTTKHHDGFCLWDTRQTDYNIMRTPFARDVTRELADACRRRGLMFCAYHSICDWYHPDYPLGSPGGKSRKPAHDMDRYTRFLKNQLAELVQNYGPLGVLWFDGEWEKPWTEERGADLYAFLRGLQPSLLINNRVSKARAGMAGTSAPGQFAADFDTPEQRVGNYQDSRPWETNMTICKQWAWKPDDAMKSLAECIGVLARTAGGDGNLLFNVGPMPTGEIEPRQVDRLREIGAWLRASGESIYATRGGPFKPAPHVVSTRRDTRIYLHILAWPEATLRLPAIPARITRARPLAGGEATVRQTDTGIEIDVPANARHEIDTVVVLELDRPALEIEPVTVANVPQSRDLIIVAGQSNAVGFDAYPDLLPHDPRDKDTLFWWRCGDPPPDNHDTRSGHEWTSLRPQPRGEPIPRDSAGPGEPAFGLKRQYGNFTSPAGGFGPEIGLARHLRAREARPLAIVKTAFSGTGMRTDWNPADKGDGGACYRAMTAELRAAIAAARARGISLNPRALVWVQGESDANPTDAPDYERALGAMIAALRQELRSPRLAALLGVNTRFGNGKNRFVPEIVQAQRALAAKDPLCAYVDTAGAETLPPSHTHFTAAGTLEIGTRFADTLLQLETRTP